MAVKFFIFIFIFHSPCSRRRPFSTSLDGSYLDQYEEIVGNADENLDKAKKMYMDTLAPGTVSIIKQCLYTSCSCYFLFEIAYLNACLVRISNLFLLDEDGY